MCAKLYCMLPKVLHLQLEKRTKFRNQHPHHILFQRVQIVLVENMKQSKPRSPENKSNHNKVWNCRCNHVGELHPNVMQHWPSSDTPASANEIPSVSPIHVGPWLWTWIQHVQVWIATSVLLSQLVTWVFEVY